MIKMSFNWRLSLFLDSSQCSFGPQGFGVGAGALSAGN